MSRRISTLVSGSGTVPVCPGVQEATSTAIQTSRRMALPLLRRLGRKLLDDVRRALRLVLDRLPELLPNGEADDGDQAEDDDVLDRGQPCAIIPHRAEAAPRARSAQTEHAAPRGKSPTSTNSGRLCALERAAPGSRVPTGVPTCRERPGASAARASERAIPAGAGAETATPWPAPAPTVPASGGAGALRSSRMGPLEADARRFFARAGARSIRPRRSWRMTPEVLRARRREARAWVADRGGWIGHLPRREREIHPCQQVAETARRVF